MMFYDLRVDNIKCEGCAASILSKLSDIAGVSQVKVDVGQGQVSWHSDSDLTEQVAQCLHQLGYPQAGSTSGLDALGAKAKSYVSCAIGKMSKE